MSSYRDWIDECLSMPEPNDGAVMRKSSVSKEDELTVSGESATTMKTSAYYFVALFYYSS